MSQTAGADLNKADCAAALSWPTRQVHLVVLAAFAGTGQPPRRGELERIAQVHGADPAAVLAELAERDVIAFGEAGDIRAAYPFSPAPTPIRVSWEGGPTDADVELAFRARLCCPVDDAAKPSVRRSHKTG